MKLISVGEAPRPSCGPKEAVVRVKATALNIEDIMTAVGRRPLVYLAATADQPVVLGRGCGHHGPNNYRDTKP
jgi:NADPH:quinone reductase-like Zn-dependent oxidoreductase